MMILFALAVLLGSSKGLCQYSSSGFETFFSVHLFLTTRNTGKQNIAILSYDLNHLFHRVFSITKYFIHAMRFISAYTGNYKEEIFNIYIEATS